MIESPQLQGTVYSATQKKASSASSFGCLFCVGPQASVAAIGTTSTAALTPAAPWSGASWKPIAGREPPKLLPHEASKVEEKGQIRINACTKFHLNKQVCHFQVWDSEDSYPEQNDT